MWSRTDCRRPRKFVLVLVSWVGRGADVTLGALDFRRGCSFPLVRWNLRTRPSASATHGSALPPWTSMAPHSPVEPLLSSAELVLLSTGRLLSILVRARGWAAIVNEARRARQAGALTESPRSPQTLILSRQACRRLRCAVDGCSPSSRLGATTMRTRALRSGRRGREQGHNATSCSGRLRWLRRAHERPGETGAATVER